jgi:hypothetical protein
MFCLTRSRCLVVAASLAMAGNLSAQPAPADEDIRGPKPLVEIPQPKEPPVAFWSGIAGGVILVILAAWLLRKHARRQRRRSPQEISLASLRELEATRESLAADAFADRAAQTVREYISGRFRLVAPRRTTEEFLRILSQDEKSPLAAESDHLRVFLKSCDLAKFAGSNLNSMQRDELIRTARDFINSTSKAATP